MPSDATITVVSGLPRSGTSMMMPMLAAGGRLRLQVVYAEDLARAVARLVTGEASGGVLYAAHPEVLNHRRIAEVLASLRVPPARTFPVPAAMIRLGHCPALVAWLGAGDAGPATRRGPRAAGGAHDHT